MLDTNEVLPQEKLVSPIECLNLPTRAYNPLKRAGINFVSQIVEYGEERISNIYQLGKTHLDTIFENVATYLGISRERLYLYSTDAQNSTQKPIREDIAQLPINVLELSSRSFNALQKANIFTIGDLLKQTESELYNLQGIGVTSLEEIKKRLPEFIQEFSAQAILREDITQLPVTVLRLSRRSCNALQKANILTISDLLKQTESELRGLEGIGTTSAEEIKGRLVEFIRESFRLAPAQLSVSIDSRPLLLDGIPDNQPNLLKLIIPFSEKLLQVLEYERGLHILKRRYGLEDGEIYSLDDIGSYYSISRQRVQQIEATAKKKIRNTLFGEELTGWKVPSAIINEASTLSQAFQSQSEVLTEQEILLFLEKRYEFKATSEDSNPLAFLLAILGFDPLAQSALGLQQVQLNSAWVTSHSYIKPILYQAIKATHRILIESTLKTSFFKLTVEVNRKRKEKIRNEYIRHAIKICSEIEEVDEEYLQIRFQYLRSNADKAYRVLYEAGAPLHLRDIVREINHRLAKSGEPATLLRSIQGQLVADPRFAPIGRTGQWILKEWEHIRTETISDLIQEFFHLKQTSATVEEVYEYVSSQRTDVPESTVGLHLTTNRELYIKVSKDKYELVAWGGTPYTASPRLTAEEVHEKLTYEIKALFAERKDNTIPLKELINHLIEKTGVPKPTVYSWLRRSPTITWETGRKQHKLAQYVSNAPSEKAAKLTTRETIQQTVEEYLSKQPNQRALVSKVAAYVTKATGCNRLAVYGYLSDMDRVRRDYDDEGRLFCYIEKQTETTLSFPQIGKIDDVELQQNLYRATRNLTVDNIDMGLFQLGKLFERELKSYLLEVQTKGTFLVTRHDLSKLVYMIDCVEKNGIVTKKHHLTLLREERNERAHGEIPDLEERKRLTQYAPFLGDLYIDYIIFFYEKRKEL